jgi:hypothetical protein
MVPCAGLNSVRIQLVIVKRLRLGSKICSNRTARLWACQEQGGRDIMSEIGIERVFKSARLSQPSQNVIGVEL